MAQLLSSQTAVCYWQRVRTATPLVFCMTNDVVTNWTANVLLAAGASPAMLSDPSESEALAAVASALSINVGTLHVAQAEAMKKAVASAQRAGKPWVLDPVAVGLLPLRTELCRDLLRESPTVIRGNPSEILVLAGEASQGRGADSTQSSDEALAAAKHLALGAKTIVAVTGASDYITDGERTLRIDNGHPLLQRVTGTGCALSALVAAYVSTALNRSEALDAAASACAVFSIAGEEAAQKALDRNEGSGSFAVYLLDALTTLDETTLEKRMERKMK
ncbi:MAG: hydroxyethylthiazole kinase [Proteobacteria bacterium]|nr:hydroxyethylthiazole kinase [Pseudomonadota bacterium]MCL2307667.1 hydroxyethylthiazole kinase [Pseudomonadota bacterium]